MANGKLLRILGVGFGIAVIIGNTIGAGILAKPGQIAKILPSEWFFVGVWVVGGLYALIGSVSIAELGAMIPRAGGQYVFAQRALGPYAGFIVGWSDWLSTCGTTAAVSIVVGEYAVKLVPGLAGGHTAIALATAVGLAMVQARGVKWGGRLQEVTGLLKTVAFLVLIARCLLFSGSTASAQPVAATVPVSGLVTLGAFVIALQSVNYTYDGWAGAVYFAEEVDNPGRNIPRATFMGVLLVTAIYVLLNFALVRVLSLERIAGDSFAPGVAASMIFGSGSERIFLALVIVSLVSGINAYHLMATRTLFAMSRDGLVWHEAQRVNPAGTPTIALALSTVVAVLFLLTGTFDQVTAVLAFFFITNYTLSFIALFVLRRREPNLARPYRAWGYPITPALSLLGSVAVLIGAVLEDRSNSLWALGLLGVSYPVYRLLQRRGRVPRRQQRRRRRKRSRK